MGGKHSKPGTSGESFDAQWNHSVAQAAAKPEPTLQEKVDTYVAQRREDNANQEG